MNDNETQYQNIERLIIKVGTGFLFDKDGDIEGYVFRADQLDALVEEVYELSNKMDVVIVSSGAIATAMYRLGISEVPKDNYKRAQLAGIGQPNLFIQYQQRFENYGKQVAQCLITYDDISIRHRRRNLRTNQDGYFRDDVISIYNENDFVTLEEIKKLKIVNKKIGFGDNDILAARLACTIDADLLVMLSYSVEGLGSGGGESKEEAREILDSENIPMKIINDRYERDSSGIYKPKIRKLLP